VGWVAMHPQCVAAVCAAWPGGGCGLRRDPSIVTYVAPAHQHFPLLFLPALPSVRSSSGSSSSSTACPPSSPASKSPQNALTSPPPPLRASAACPAARNAAPTTNQVRPGARRSGIGSAAGGLPAVAWGCMYELRLVRVAQLTACNHAAIALRRLPIPTPGCLQARRRRVRWMLAAAATSPSPLWRPSAAPAPRAARGMTPSSRSTTRWVPVVGWVGRQTVGRQMTAGQAGRQADAHART
jgi:hypothetical protein